MENMNEPSLNQWTSLFLFAAVQGIFLAFILLIHKKGNRKANRILSLLIALFSVMLLYYVAYWTQLSAKYSWLNGWVEPYPFLFGPIAYYYLIQLERKKISANTWLHFIPAIINLVWMAPFIIRNIFGRVELLRNNFFIHSQLIATVQFSLIILQLISMIIYALLMMRLVTADKLKLNRYASKEEILKQSWLKKIVWLFNGFVIASCAYWLLAWTNFINPEFDYMISFAMSLFIYAVGYLGYRQPEIFNGYVTYVKKEEPKYANSTIIDELANDILKRLLETMENEKPFLDSEIKIQGMAEKLCISSHQLSQIINLYLKQSFPDFINGYRIKEAKRLLLSPEYENQKILSVAFDSGFQNKATFNSLFKKHTGMSPSEFKKYEQKVMLN